jgi:hypothetical protein
MVLIDGDGMIFNNELLRLGEEGGRKAATQVKANISRFLRTEKEGCPSEFKVVARVYANVRGLSETLVRAGILSSSLIFEEFVRGFTRGDALCDFIDVGAGKDRADLKINGQSLSFQLANLLGTYTNGKLAENFKVHIHDYQCRQVVFGCSHDNGYARLLEEYMDEPQVMSRLTLLVSHLLLLPCIIIASNLLPGGCSVPKGVGCLAIWKSEDPGPFPRGQDLCGHDG